MIMGSGGASSTFPKINRQLQMTQQISKNAEFLSSILGACKIDPYQKLLLGRSISISKPGGRGTNLTNTLGIWNGGCELHGNQKQQWKTLPSKILVNDNNSLT